MAKNIPDDWNGWLDCELEEKQEQARLAQETEADRNEDTE